MKSFGKMLDTLTALIGGPNEKVPTMAPFKNGAFAMALEKQIPKLL